MQQTAYSYEQQLIDFLEIEQTAEADSNLEKILEILSEVNELPINDLERDDDTTYIPYSSIRPTLTNEAIVTFTGKIQKWKTGLTEDHIVAVIGKGSNGMFAYPGQVDTLKKRSISVEFETQRSKWNEIKNDLNKTGSGAVVGLVNLTVYERERKATRLLADSEEKWDLVTGKIDPTFENVTAGRSSPFNEMLYENESQAIGINRALSANRVECLHGPPGTGKTAVIKELTRRMVEAGNRVLLTAETNPAVDNMLLGSGETPANDSLETYANEDGFSIDRYNERNSNREYIQDNYDRENHHHADVVLSTNNSAARMREKGGVKFNAFDYLIVDEAGQARKTSVFIPMLLSECTILVGDHKQLPATRESQKAYSDDTRHRSLFELLYGKSGLYEDTIGVQFDTQYRSVQPIPAFSNQEFYDGSINHAADISPIDGLDPVRLYDLDVERHERKRDHSPYNRVEADFIELYVKLLFERFDIAPDQIGVVAPYAEQQEFIGSQLRYNSVDGAEDVMVATIDRFQGSEKDVILISCTRSNEDNRIGFLGEDSDDGAERLNVALTRPRKHRCIVGDWDTLRSDPMYERLYQHHVELDAVQERTESQITATQEKLGMI